MQSYVLNLQAEERKNLRYLAQRSDDVRSVLMTLETLRWTPDDIRESLSRELQNASPCINSGHDAKTKELQLIDWKLACLP